MILVIKKQKQKTTIKAQATSLCIHSPVPCISTAHGRLQFPYHDPAVTHYEGGCILINRTAHHTEGTDSFRHPDCITLASQVIGKLLNGIWILRENGLFQMAVRKHRQNTTCFGVNNLNQKNIILSLVQTAQTSVTVHYY